MIEVVLIQCLFIAERAGHLMDQRQFSKMSSQEILADAKESGGLRYARDIISTAPTKSKAVTSRFEEDVYSACVNENA